ncbi:MAG: hypothetical protein CSA55_03135 [Ilumatobacter coccineus]|uniref:Metallo-beta-lactamase domain-containing protein n=1 Tax=Ilumatobacter coccineus TaxID=467094 RepID=A0A2G6KCB6_9ACTN|nr:MAG: hypothetical protein CSA55_03135 [Ilumatobacter coccineus]
MDDPYWSHPGVEVYRWVVGPFENNVFVISCGRTGESILIDAAAEPELLLDIAERFHVGQIVQTHGHFDHIGAVTAVRDAGYPVAVGTDDAPKLADVGYDTTLDHHDVITFGDQRLIVLHTPGHTPGSISLHLEGAPLVFSGDTLFPGGPGATHFDDADFDTIIASITDHLFSLPDNTVVLPGHGDSTTIGAERPHLDDWIARRW